MHQQLSFFSNSSFFLVNSISESHLERALLEKCNSHLPQNGFELFLISELSKESFTQFLLNLTTKFRYFLYFISTSNPMFGRAIFKNFEIALVKRGQPQNFQKSQGWFIPKIARTKHVITG